MHNDLKLNKNMQPPMKNILTDDKYTIINLIFIKFKES